MGLRPRPTPLGHPPLLVNFASFRLILVFQSSILSLPLLGVRNLRRRLQNAVCMSPDGSSGNGDLLLPPVMPDIVPSPAFKVTFKRTTYT